jgi:uncharacterized protein YdhG (YjbR/CyaY superfamily)
MDKAIKYNSVDDYINSLPTRAKTHLETIRSIVKKVAPNAEETIKYGIPTFRLNGNLVHYAAFSNHIGFYPTPSGISAFKKELSQYKTAKGSVQFPLDKPLPTELIHRIVEFRVQESQKQ